MRILLALLFIVFPLRADVIFPSDAGYVDVKKDLGAKGDGVTDDTIALCAAMAGANGFVYLPNGVYLVSDTIQADKFKRRIWQGQSRAGVVIKLKDNAPGFEDAAKPKPILSFFNQFMNPKANNGQAFRNSLYNLTIDSGANNAGAVGLHYFNNNQGMIEDLTIRSSDAQKRGKAGIALVTNWPGPAYFKNIEIEGFDYGIWSSIGQYSFAIEHLKLQNQRIAGIYNARQILSIRDLQSQNRVPVLQQEKGFVVLLDGNFAGGDANLSVLESNGNLYLRNVKAEGYGETLKHNETTLRGSINEWSSGQVTSLFPSAKGSLKLPVEEAPHIEWDKLENWANVQTFGAKSNDKFDSTQAVQKAIDSGKSTIYFPKGTYLLNDTIRVRGRVQRVIGFESTIQTGQGFKDNDKPLFRLEDGTGAVLFERWESGYGNQGQWSFEQASNRPMILKNIIGLGVRGSREATANGSIFLEDYCGAPLHIGKQKVWARQFNPENNGTKVINDGGTFWALNLKTEKAGTIVETKNGASEILGGYFYYNRGTEGSATLINHESRVSCIAALYIYGDASGPRLSETRNGQTQTSQKWPFLYVGAP